MCITSFIFTHVFILRILIQYVLVISSFCSSGTCIPQIIPQIYLLIENWQKPLTLLLWISFYPQSEDKNGRQVASHLTQSDQEQSRKSDNLPQFNSSTITTWRCAFPVANLRWFEVAYLELIKYLITILNNLSSFTLMLLLLSKKDKMPLK